MCILCQSKLLILVKSPGIKQSKVLEKQEKCPGKSWNLDYVFLWQPWHAQHKHIVTPKTSPAKTR